MSSHLSLVAPAPAPPFVEPRLVEAGTPPRRRTLDPLAREALSVVGGGALGGLVGWAVGWPVGWVGCWLVSQSWRCRCGRARHGQCDSWRYT